MKKTTLAIITAALITAAAAAGCSSSGNTSNEITQVNNSVSVQSPITETASSDTFTDRDLSQEADTSGAETIIAEDSQTIEITKAGVYVITGTASECTIKVKAGDEDKVQLVLDDVSITNSDFPAIYVISADKCFITTADGSTNTLSVTGDFRADDDTNTDAVIFSKEDIVLNGLGTLNITSANGNGITGKDDIKITGGTYNITSALDSIEANDLIAVSGGTFTINSSKDGLHAENSDDTAKGVIEISGGSFEINAMADGIQSTSSVTVSGGTINITASEGIEATYIVINDGSINITASDDGINASEKSTAYSPAFEINGGELTVSMGQGDTDAIDSNGSIYVNGGTINITAATSSFDYDQTAEFNGGTIVINGQEVSEIPQSMMGGGNMGGRGNMNGGNRGGKF